MQNKVRLGCGLTLIVLYAILTSRPLTLMIISFTRTPHWCADRVGCSSTPSSVAALPVESTRTQPWLARLILRLTTRRDRLWLRNLPNKYKHVRKPCISNTTVRAKKKNTNVQRLGGISDRIKKIYNDSVVVSPTSSGWRRKLKCKKKAPVKSATDLHW